MEAVPSVPFHERAPDLMKEEDIKNNQVEAEESASRLQGSCWQPPRDMREGFPEERPQRADISHQLHPNGEGQPIASGAERQGGPIDVTAEKAQRGQRKHPMLLYCHRPQAYFCSLEALESCFAVSQNIFVAGKPR